MTTIPEKYRAVFTAPDGPDVLHDLILAVGRLAESERAGGYAVIARITRMMHAPARPATTRSVRAVGQRLSHG